MKWFNDRKMATKLAIGFGISLLLTLAVGAQALRSLAAITEINETLNNVHAQQMRTLQDANISQLTAGRASRNMVIFTRPEELRPEAAVLDESWDAYDKQIAAVAALPMSEQLRAQLVTLGQISGEVKAQQLEIGRLGLANEAEKATQLLAALGPKATEMQKRFDEVAQLKSAEMKAMAEQVVATSASARTITVTTIVVCVVLTIGLVVTISRIVTAPLRQTVELLGHVAKADFSRDLKVDSRDEIGDVARALNGAVGQIRDALGNVRVAAEGMARGDLSVSLRQDLPGELGVMAGALNEAVDKLRQAMADVRDTANSVASSSDQLAAASQEISSGAQEQASSLEETAASLEQMTATIKQNADNAQQASQLAGGARSTAEDGGQVVSEAVQAMAAINDSSKKIADIITTIDEIAFQTNLLALNAAVEAARAGEQGRGFAVVAAEVRNLAQRSATAAKEIKDLISDSTRKVEAGSALVNASGKTLNEIVAAVKRVTDIVAEIAAASREQSAGIEQVNKAVTQMDQVTQANASQTEEMSGTSESLSAEAAKLQSLVRRFKLGEEAHAEPPARPVARRPVQMTPRGAAPRRAPITTATAGTAALSLDAEFKEF